MNWKNRLTNYNFWISIFSAVLLILQALKIEFNIAYVNEIFTAVLGLLVVIGIINDPTKTSVKTTETLQPNHPTKEKQTENTVPTDKENETDSFNIQNDFQTTVNKISIDIDEKLSNLTTKLEELKKFNNLSEDDSVAQLKNNSKDQEAEVIENKTAIEEIPAVAEIKNPYIDVIN